MNQKGLLVTVFLTVFYIHSSKATLSYVESFDYGTFDGDLAGKSGGVGFSGAWAQTNPGLVYVASGLSFSDLPVTGGAAFASGTDGIGNALQARPLAATLSGAYYGMFLSRVSFSSQMQYLTGGVGHGDFGVAPDRGCFGIVSPSTAFDGEALSVWAGSQVPRGASGNALNQGQTYLTIFKFDTALRATKGWVLTAAQYDGFKLGGITETELDSASIGDAIGQVWARASVTDTAPPGGPQGPVIASHLNLFANAPGGVNALFTIDELRLSGVSIDEALSLQVPKPALKISKVGNIVVLTWSTNFPGYILEHSSNLGMTNWSALPDGPVAISNSFVYPIDMSGSGYFRLRK